MNWRDIDVSVVEGLRQLDILTARRLGWIGLGTVPSYTADLSAAAGLPLPDGYALEVYITMPPRRVFVEYYVDGKSDVPVASALLQSTSEALARTLAWHMLMDEKEKEGA